MDWTCVPSGELGRQAFVEEIKEVDDRAERYFLELKSDIDLSAKEGQAKVAKFILGAANRDPEIAARRFGGHALMVLGVSKGAAPGIPFFEAKDLQKVVTKFISHDGPKWDFNSVEVDDTHSVVIIEVAPPVPGVIWTCHAFGLENLEDGAIYIRADGETRKATGAEIRSMLARVREAGPNVELEVEMVGRARAYHCDDSVLDDYLTRERTRLLAALPTDKRRTFSTKDRSAADGVNLLNESIGASMAKIAAGFSGPPENRTVVQYQKQITDWEDAVRNYWPTLLDEAASTVWDAVQIRVRNGSLAFLEALEFDLYIEGDVQALKKILPDDEADLLDGMPEPPRVWGPHGLDIASIMAPTLYPPPVYDLPSPGAVRFDNVGSVRLEFDIPELRPSRTYTTDDDDFVLVLRAPMAEALNARWTATAKGHHAEYSGELSVVVEPRVYDFTGGMRKALGLEPIEEDD